MQTDPTGIKRAQSADAARAGAVTLPGESNIWTPTALRALSGARQLAIQDGQSRVESAHLLLSILRVQNEGKDYLRSLIELSGLKWHELELYAQSAVGSEGALPQDETVGTGEVGLTPVACQILESAFKQARRNNHNWVGTPHLFVACFRAQKTPGIAEVLAPLGVSADQLNLHLCQLVRAQTTQAAVASEHPLALLSGQGQRALDAAEKARRDANCGRISTLHLLLGLLENPDSEAVAALQTTMVDLDDLRQKARAAHTSDGAIAGAQRRFTPAAKRALDRAKASAMERRQKFIGPEDILLGLLPARALLVERAQWGGAPDDPAAALVAELDAPTLRAIFAPPSAAPPPVAVSRTLPKRLSIPPAFLATFLLQIVVAVAMKNFAPGSTQTRGLALLMALALISSGFASAWALLAGKSARLKATMLWAFGGALAGAMAGVYVVTQ